MSKKDTQARAYMMTCNNPKDKGYTHEVLCEKLSKIPHIDYWCFCDEIGLETQTHHTHIYFHAKQGIRHSTLRNLFPQMDIQVTQGTAQQCRDYIRKEGAYLESEKKETNLIDTFREWGELPVSKQGKRTDLEKLYDMVKDGYTDSEIIENLGDTAIKYIDKIKKLRYTYLTDLYKSNRRLDLKVHYICGKTGTGKTRNILDIFGDKNVFRVTDYQHPFDGYQCEPVIVFEEFRSSLRLQDMLNYLDVYPIDLPARYTNGIACYKFAFIVSNWDFEQQYAEIQKDSDQKSTYEAWVRRFNAGVKVYTAPNTYTEYPNIHDYLKRKEKFHKIPDDVKVPFDEVKSHQESLDFDDETDDMPFNI